MKIILKNIAGITSAEIEFAEITVFAGQNATRKTTISKCLMLIHDLINNRKSYVEEIIRETYQEVLYIHQSIQTFTKRIQNQPIQNQSIQISRYTQQIQQQEQFLKDLLNSISLKQFSNIENHHDKIEDAIAELIHKVRDITTNNPLENGEKRAVNRIIERLEKLTLREQAKQGIRDIFDNNMVSYGQTIASITLENQEQKLCHIAIDLTKEKQSTTITINPDIAILYPYKNIFYIDITYDDDYKFIFNVNIDSELYSWKNIFYIESSLILDYLLEMDYKNGDYIINKEVKKALTIELKESYFMEKDKIKINEFISNIINGRIEINKQLKQAVYITNEGYTLSMRNTAESIKAFGIIQLLLNNNWISNVFGKNTLLYIDSHVVDMKQEWKTLYKTLLLKLVELGIDICIVEDKEGVNK